MSNFYNRTPIYIVRKKTRTSICLIFSYLFIIAIRYFYGTYDELLCMVFYSSILFITIDNTILNPIFLLKKDINNPAIQKNCKKIKALTIINLILEILLCLFVYIFSVQYLFYIASYNQFLLFIIF